MSKGKTQYPQGRMLVIRDCMKAICMDNSAATRLLCALMYWYDYSDYEAVDGVFVVKRTQSELIQDMCDETNVTTLHSVAIPFLQLLGYLDIEGKDGTLRYLVHVTTVHAALDAFSKKTLPTFLRGSIEPQLQKFAISLTEDELQKFAINSKILEKHLQKIVIANKENCNCKRGRKPKPHEALEGISESTENKRDITENSNRESNGTAEADAILPPSWREFDEGTLDLSLLLEGESIIREEIAPNVFRYRRSSGLSFGELIPIREYDPEGDIIDASQDTPPPSQDGMSSDAKQATAESHIAPGSTRTTRSEQFRDLLHEWMQGDEQEQRDTWQALERGLIESGVLPPREETTHAPALSEAGRGSERLQESEEEPHGYNNADSDHDTRGRGDGSSHHGTRLDNEQADCQQFPARGHQALAPRHQSAAHSEQDVPGEHRQSPALHRESSEGQVTEGEHAHEHPHSHPSDSSSPSTGLEGAESPGQDGTVQADAERERALAEGVVAHDQMAEIRVAHSGDSHNLPDHAAIQASLHVHSAPSSGVCDDTAYLHSHHRIGAEPEGEKLNGRANNDMVDLALGDASHLPGVPDSYGEGLVVDDVLAMDTAGNGHPGGNGSALDRVWAGVCEDADGQEGQAVAQQTPSLGGSAVGASSPELLAVEPGGSMRDAIPVAPVQDIALSLPEQVSPPQPAQAASGQGGTDEQASSQEGKKPTRPRQAKVKLIPEGPPVMPPDDARWNDETGVQIMESKKGRRYSETTRKGELRKMGELRKIEVKPGVCITRQQYEQACDELLGDPWWEEKGVEPMIRHMVKDERIIGLLKTVERKHLRLVTQNNRSSNGASKPAVTNGPTTNIRELVRQREAARATQIQ